MSFADEDAQNNKTRRIAIGIVVRRCWRLAVAWWWMHRSHGNRRAEAVGHSAGASRCAGRD